MRVFALVLMVIIGSASTALSADPLPNVADQGDIELVRDCAYEKHYRNALKCIPALVDYCFTQELDNTYTSGPYCYRRAFLAWEDYRESQLAAVRDYMGESGPARAALEASVTAFAAWRAAECASELASWPQGSEEGADVFGECNLRLTARRAVFLGVKGVP